MKREYNVYTFNSKTKEWENGGNILAETQREAEALARQRYPKAPGLDVVLVERTRWND